MPTKYSFVWKMKYGICDVNRKFGRHNASWSQSIFIGEFQMNRHGTVSADASNIFTLSFSRRERKIGIRKIMVKNNNNNNCDYYCCCHCWLCYYASRSLFYFYTILLLLVLLLQPQPLPHPSHHNDYYKYHYHHRHRHHRHYRQWD